jgi:uncharacterized membrane protein
MENRQSFWIRIIEAIERPLGFFVLALLIAESFLATVLITGNASEDFRFKGICFGVGMFVLVVLIVAALVWFKPEYLLYDMKAHLINAGKIPYGNEKQIVTSKEVDDLFPVEAPVSENKK